MLRRIWRASIWHPDAIPPDEWKYRSIKRVWLPIFDLIMVCAGIWVVLWSTPVLDGLFSGALIDATGTLFAVTAATCLCGVIFPALWTVEVVGKSVLGALLASYAAALWVTAATGGRSAAFTATIVTAVVIIPAVRLSILGEENKERRVADD